MLSVWNGNKTLAGQCRLPQFQALCLLSAVNRAKFVNVFNGEIKSDTDTSIETSQSVKLSLQVSPPTLKPRSAECTSELLNISHTHHAASLLPSLSSPPPGGLSAGQPHSQLPGAAVRPPPPAPPVGGHLPGSHLAELRPGPLVWSSGQRPREALHPAVGSHP